MSSASSSTANNKTGRNQWRDQPILEAIPDLPMRLQKYINEGIRQKDIPEHVRKDCNGQIVSLSSIKKFMKRFNIKTVKHSGLSDIEKGVAILRVVEQDPLGRYGCRLVKEKLQLKGTHVSRDFTMTFLKAENPDVVARRHPSTRKQHKHGIYSSGPNEEWCLDGHEKILLSMGIAIYGIIDKFSRMELALYAVPDARNSDVPVAVYLRAVKQQGGIPLSTTSDKGSELGKLISLVQELRKTYQPYITEADVPSHSAVKSPQNITRERGWRPIWEKELANLLHFYRTGQFEAGYLPNDDFHIALSRWLWASVVQEKLNELRVENQVHTIRNQPKILLPTDARRIDLYTDPLFECL
ncbi:hypothetical protein EST38_g7018 [Candolleomyces aberdarensis]|uniref:Integrase catalytic domain-containing protein n=1 Tax=Candolleomyces aberdarensis TaxID=2316362 RepID=A0A4Q2DJJ2_9AGAR|nr:hypothetical protein EST38_g7018 [Candolleomyces aberdarensis]